MTTITKKQQLEAAIRDLTIKLNAIKAAEAEKEAQTHIGKCYRRANSYGIPTEDSEFWWLYTKALRAENGELICFQFQKDKYGQITIQPDSSFPPFSLSSFQEITDKEFEQAWLALTRWINDQLVPHALRSTA